MSAPKARLPFRWRRQFDRLPVIVAPFVAHACDARDRGDRRAMRSWALDAAMMIRRCRSGAPLQFDFMEEYRPC